MILPTYRAIVNGVWKLTDSDFRWTTLSVETRSSLACIVYTPFSTRVTRTSRVRYCSAVDSRTDDFSRVGLRVNVQRVLVNNIKTVDSNRSLQRYKICIMELLNRKSRTFIRFFDNLWHEFSFYRILANPHNSVCRAASSRVRVSRVRQPRILDLHSVGYYSRVSITVGLRWSFVLRLIECFTILHLFNGLVRVQKEWQRNISTIVWSTVPL